MAEWSIAAVLKTVDLRGSGGSNPSLSAEKWLTDICKPLFFYNSPKVPQKWGAFQSFGDIRRIGNKIKRVPFWGTLK